MTEYNADQTRIPTGIAGLDYILDGGLPAHRTYLVEGEPGAGKTTLALQMLVHAVSQGRDGLLISVAQSQEELRDIAKSHGMDLQGIKIISPRIDESPDGVSVSTDSSDLHTLLSTVEDALDTHKPDVFVFDSLLELRLLSNSDIDFRRKLLHLRRLSRNRGATTLLLDHTGRSQTDGFERGTVHGVLALHTAAPGIGQINRTLTVMKLRGATFREGLHDFVIRSGGLEVFPRVIPSERRALAVTTEQLQVSEPTLNEMLGGGLEYGTSCLIAGQSGSGKSTLATMVARAAAESGQNAALFLFEERPEVYEARSQSLNMSLSEHMASGRVTLKHFEPAETSPGALSRTVIDAALNGARVIVLDSLTGYISALPNRDNVEAHLYTLIQYLTRQGCLVIVTVAQAGLMGEPPVSEINASFMADAVVLLRQYSEASVIRRSVAVLKKRHSDHERSLQELVIRPGSVRVRRVED